MLGAGVPTTEESAAPISRDGSHENSFVGISYYNETSLLVQFLVLMLLPTHDNQKITGLTKNEIQFRVCKQLS